GHGAMPQDTKDSILIASQLVDNLQQIVSRRVNPLDSAVLSVCNFEAAGPYNVIANSAKLSGTVRTLKEDVRDHMDREIRRVVEGTCHLSDADFEYEYKRGYPVLVNHREETEFVRDIAKTVTGVNEVNELGPLMGFEDYAFYLQEVIGTYFFPCAQPDGVEDPYLHHL